MTRNSVYNEINYQLYESVKELTVVSYMVFVLKFKKSKTIYVDLSIICDNPNVEKRVCITFNVQKIVLSDRRYGTILDTNTRILNNAVHTSLPVDKVIEQLDGDRCEIDNIDLQT